MTTLNKATLIGYLGRDPEMRTTANGDAVAQLAIATTEAWKDKATGEKKDPTEWHRVVLYRKLAEISGQYLKKGSLVYVEGRLQTRKWTGKDDVERYTVEIIADDMRMLGTRSSAIHAHDDNDGDGDSRNHAASSQTRTPAPRVEVEDDAIPF
jgi:single-strand DNA-binding protein